MQLYEGTVGAAIRSIEQPGFFADCARRFKLVFGSTPGPEEFASWCNSWPTLLDILRAARLEELHLLFEYRLPGTGERIDALLLGESPDRRLRAVVIELKQWARVQTDPARPLEVEIGGRIAAHPGRQVGSYVNYLQEWVSRDSLPLDVRGVAVLHNAESPLITELRMLVGDGPSAPFPLLGRDDFVVDHPAVQLPPKFHCADLRPAEPERIARFFEVEHRPSPRLLEQTGALLARGLEFRLVGDQDRARNRVRRAVVEARMRSGGSIIVVTGGPGTGKTVIACRLLGDLITDDGRGDRRPYGRDTRLLTPTGTLTKQLQRAIGPDARGLVATFVDKIPSTVKPGGIVLLDEAHRARTYRQFAREGRFPLMLGTLIERSAVTVLFLDEGQIIRPAEGVTVGELKKFAQDKRLRFSHIDLRTQFRCNGSRVYLDWIDELFGTQAENPMWDGTDYDLAVASDPEDLAAWVESHKAQGSSARIAAGFCWPWTQSARLPLAKDVEIAWGGRDGRRIWKRPWNSPLDQTLSGGTEVPGRPYWATDSGGENQVGCIYTAQGLEYDYGAVIIGDDLRRRDGRWQANPEASHDRELRGLSPDQYLRYALNVYRVLATRGAKGTRFYSTDPETHTYVRSLVHGGAGSRSLSHA